MYKKKGGGHEISGFSSSVAGSRSSPLVKNYCLHSGQDAMQSRGPDSDGTDAIERSTGGSASRGTNELS